MTQNWPSRSNWPAEPPAFRWPTLSRGTWPNTAALTARTSRLRCPPNVSGEPPLRRSYSNWYTSGILRCVTVIAYPITSKIRSFLRPPTFGSLFWTILSTSSLRSISTPWYHKCRLGFESPFPPFSLFDFDDSEPFFGFRPNRPLWYHFCRLGFRFSASVVFPFCF